MNGLRKYLTPEEYDGLLIEPLIECFEELPEITAQDPEWVARKIAASLSPNILELLREHYLQGMYHHKEQDSYWNGPDETPLDKFL